MTTVAPCCAVTRLASLKHRDALGRVGASKEEVCQAGAADAGSDDSYICVRWKRLSRTMAEER